MFNKWFGKKKEQKPATRIFAPVTGTIVLLEEVPDPVFAQKMAGDGFAILPSEGMVVAPVNGTIEVLFPTKHAVAIKSEEGVEILLHIGINTVELSGDGFESLVQKGDKVKQGDALVKFDIAFLEQRGYPIITPVLITNAQLDVDLNALAGKQVQAGTDHILDVVIGQS